jgi:hypothetical protein
LSVRPQWLHHVSDRRNVQYPARKPTTKAMPTPATVISIARYLPASRIGSAAWWMPGQAQRCRLAGRVPCHGLPVAVVVAAVLVSFTPEDGKTVVPHNVHLPSS